MRSRDNVNEHRRPSAIAADHSSILEGTLWPKARVRKESEDWTFHNDFHQRLCGETRRLVS
jgi:hypothetical protein